MITKYLSSWNLEIIRNNKITGLLEGDILELGCWAGKIPAYLSKRGSDVQYTWINHSKDGVESLKTKFPEYSFLNHDLDYVFTLPENKKVDTVVAVAVIEHIYNQKNFFITAVENLKPGWKIIITTPTNFGNDIIYPLMCKFWLRKWIGVLMDHITIYNKDRFLVVANDFNLEIEHFEKFELFCNQIIIFRKK